MFFSINSILFNLNLQNANSLEKKSGNKQFDKYQEIITPKSSDSTPLWVHTAGDSIETVAISANGDYIVSGGRDNNVYLFNKSSSTPIWSYSLPSMVWALAISAEGNYIVAAAYWDGIFFFNKSSPTPMWNYTIGGASSCVAISADGNYIVAGGGMDLYYFNKSSSTPMWAHSEAASLESVAISYNGTYIATAWGNGFHFFNKSSSTPLWSYTPDIATSVDISSDGNYIIGGSWNNNKIYVFNKSSSTPMRTYTMTGSAGIEHSVAISSDGQYMTSVSQGGWIYFFDKLIDKPVWNYSAGVDFRSVTISCDGTYIGASGSQSSNDKILLFEKSTPIPLWVYNPGNDPRCISISSDATYLVAGTQQNNRTILFNVIPGPFFLSSDAHKPETEGMFNLTWTASDFADNYSIYAHNKFITKINMSVTLLEQGINGLSYPITGLTNGTYYYKVLAYNDVGNRSSNCLSIKVENPPPIISFNISQQFLNTTEPLETDTALQINCTVSNSNKLQWVYLCENSTGIFVNRSMNLGINNEWTYIVDISTLQRGDKLSFLFYANDSYYIRKNDNNNLNFSLFIGDVYPPSSNVQFNISHIPNFVSESTLFNITTYDVGERPSGILNLSYKIDLGAWKEYNNPFNLSNLDEGMHTIYYNATDNIGNVEDTNQITVYIDLNNITSFLNFLYYEDSGIKYVSNFTEFSIDWNDGMGSGLQALYYKIDSGSYFTSNMSFTLTGYSEGLHNISFYSVDNVGNIEPEKVIEIYLDTTPPELNPLSYDLLHSPNYIFDATILSFGGSENYGSLIKNFYWRIDDDNWNIGTNFSLYGFEFGEHTIHYGVIDNAGNSRNGTTVLYLVTPNSDVDADGLTYSEELVYNTDPFNDDTDGDKLSDGEEVNIYHTNPLSRDTDGDGYSDYDEIFIFMTDPNSFLSSPSAIIITIPIIIVLINFGIWRLKTRNRRKIKKEIIEQVCRTNTKALDNESIDKKLYRTASRLNFEKIIKKHEIEGFYILDGSLFITSVGIREFSEIMRKVIYNICNKELSNQKDSRLIKIGARELLEFQDILDFIKYIEF